MLFTYTTATHIANDQEVICCDTIAGGITPARSRALTDIYFDKYKFNL